MQPDTAPQNTTNDSTSLYVAIGFAILWSSLFVALTFGMFLRSGAFDTVKDIQANAELGGYEYGGYDTTSPVKIVDIDETLKSVENNINKTNNKNDYKADALNSESLGLPF